MTSKYGFSDNTAEEAAVPPVKLPEPKPWSERPSEEAVAELARRGQELGFVSREPGHAATASVAAAPAGRRRKPEPQDKVMVAGPARVLKPFRDFCDAEGLSSYWAGIEKLMKEAGRLK